MLLLLLLFSQGVADREKAVAKLERNLRVLRRRRRRRTTKRRRCHVWEKLTLKIEMRLHSR